MEIVEKSVGNALYIFLSGEIDEHSAHRDRKRTDDLIEKNLSKEYVVFNLSRVSFMDSTGIGFMIGRYKKLKQFGLCGYIEKPNLSADRVLSISGVYTLLPKIDG